MFADLLDEIGDRLDALQAEGLDSVVDARLDDEIDRLGALMTRLEAESMRRAGEWERRQLWAHDGSRSARAALSRRWGLTFSAAGQRLKVAARLREAPATRAAFAAGELSFSKVRALTTAVAEDQPEDVKEKFRAAEPELVTYMKDLTERDARHVMQFWHAHADPEGARERWNDQYGRRGLSAAVTFDGMVAIQGLLDPETGQLVLRALQWIEDQLWRADHHNKASDCDVVTAEHRVDERTPMQRKADALAELCHIALQYDRTRDTFDGRSHDRPKVALIVGPAAADGRPGLAQLADLNLPVPPEAAERICCDASVSAVLVNNNFLPLAVSHAKGQVSTAQRMALVLRDGGCVIPGCTMPPRACDVHHLIHRSKDGKHDVWTCVLACHPHHRLLHEDGWACWIDERTGRPMVRRPDGTLVPPDSSPLQLAGAGAAIAGTAERQLRLTG